MNLESNGIGKIFTRFKISSNRGWGEDREITVTKMPKIMIRQSIV